MAKGKRQPKYEPYGGIQALWRDFPSEALVEGPAGTGKSRGICEYVNAMADNYAGCRILVLRKTRTSLSESWMRTFENKVLGPDHHCLKNDVQPKNRTEYQYDNGSLVVLGGMDQPERLFSTEYDIAVVNEANELTEAEWESLHRALRNNMIPHPHGKHPDEYWVVSGRNAAVDVGRLRQDVEDGKFLEYDNQYPDGTPIFLAQLLGDCNPDAEFHWLNQRCLKVPPGMSEPRTRRICTRHEDNPTLTKQYLDRLKNNLQGVRRERLYYGRWCTAEGAVWPNFRVDKHVVHGELERGDDGVWRLYVVGRDGPVELRWFAAGVDWGFRDAGSLLVFGMDHDRTPYCVAEVHFTEKDKNWWADVAEELRQKFDIQRFICDSAEPDSVDLFNRRMGASGGHHIAVPVQKKRLGFEASASVVRERFDKDALFFWSGRLEYGEDTLLKDAGKPANVVEEIPSFVYREFKEGHRIKEEADPGCSDHGCDALRYFMWFLDTNDWQPVAEVSGYAPGTFGYELGHDDFDLWQ